MADPGKRDTDLAPTQGTEGFFSLLRARFQTVVDAESRVRQSMRDDQLFAHGEQWPEGIKAERELDGRPCLTNNRIPSFIRQVTNQQRTSKPSVRVNPVDSGADVKKAEARQGVIRQIEHASDADVAYATAGEHQVTMGRGYIRVIPEYVSDLSFDQCLKIKRVRNPFTVYLDPAHQEPDGSDARYGFVVEDLSREEFNERYPKTDAASAVDLSSLGDGLNADWFPDGKVRVAECYAIKAVATRIAQLSDGRVLDTKELPKDVRAKLAAAGIFVVKEREVLKKQLTWCLVNAVEFLEGNDDLTGPRELPGKYIPIVPVLGQETDLDGRIDLKGLVRDMIDGQRMANYWESCMTETIALAPRAPVIGAEGQFENHEAKWDSANVRNWAYLEYKPVSVEGTLAPPPQRQVVEPPIQAMVMALQRAENNLRSVSGFYDVNSEEMRPEQSGKAILARQKQGETGNSHFLDNLGRAIRQVGRIVNDLLPHYYDAGRVLRITGTDGTEQDVMVHAGPANAPDPQQLPANIKSPDQVIDLDEGSYDVTISTGPSYESARQEGVDAMVEFVRSYPAAFPIIGDLLAKNMDWPGAQQVAKRLEKMLPPNLQEDTGDPAANLQKLQQQLQQMGQVYDQLVGALHQAQDTIENKQLELASKEYIAGLQVKAQLAIAMAKVDLDQAKLQMTQQQADIDRLLQMNESRITGEAETADAERQAAQADRQREHEQAMQAGQQGHEAGMAQAGQRVDAGQADVANQQDAQMAQLAHQQQMQLQAGQQAHEGQMAASAQRHTSTEAAAGRKHDQTMAKTAAKAAPKKKPV